MVSIYGYSSTRLVRIIQRFTGILPKHKNKTWTGLDWTVGLDWRAGLGFLGATDLIGIMKENQTFSAFISSLLSSRTPVFTYRRAHSEIPLNGTTYMKFYIPVLTTKV